jgi:chromate transporter
MAKAVDFKPDIIHAHDWQTGLMMAHQKFHYSSDSFFAKTATLFTIHNLAYQGNFPAPSFHMTGLPARAYEPKGLEFYGKVSFLKAGVLIVAATVGGLTHSLPIRLFENFYRNGSLIFGGGQVLTPLLYSEFVELKHYLTSREFLSGYAIAQSIPGPVFSFSAYIGALSMKEAGISGQVAGAFLSAAGIFLPGTFLIFFLIRFWDSLKKYRAVRASLEGITAASAGLVTAAAIFMFQPLDNLLSTYAFVIATFCLLSFTRIPSGLIIIIGLFVGWLL